MNQGKFSYQEWVSDNMRYAITAVKEARAAGWSLDEAVTRVHFLHDLKHFGISIDELRQSVKGAN